MMRKKDKEVKENKKYKKPKKKHGTRKLHSL